MAPTTADAPLAETAAAKINLDLVVLGRRRDGYHELDSLVVFADRGDRLTLAASDGLSLTIHGPFAPGLAGGPDNLVHRAATSLAARLGRPPTAAITLDKRLPVAAGLGGGSADAAAALRGLRRLWRAAIDDASLRALALDLGSDVPACLAERPVRMRGRGQRLDPAPGLPALPLVLANAGRPVATAAVFARLGGFGLGPAPARDWAGRGDVTAFALWLTASRNDLEPAAVAIEPAIGRTLGALRDLPGCLLARMTGSGGTCFGVFATRAVATEAARQLAAALPAWWIEVTMTRA